MWFVNQIFELISIEEKIRGKKINKLEYRNLKSDGFSDKRILQLTSMSQKQLTNLRIESKVRPLLEVWTHVLENFLQKHRICTLHM